MAFEGTLPTAAPAAPRVTHGTKLLSQYVTINGLTERTLAHVEYGS